MLLIRNAQMEALRRQTLARFDKQLVQHFMHFYPIECRLAGGESQILRLVQRGRRRAESHGYMTQGEVALYVGLIFMLGSDFDRDPQLPWAAAQIDDTSIADPTARIRRVYGTAVEYLRTTAGDNTRHIMRAMFRIRAHDFSTASDSTGEQRENELRDLLNRLYPEKYTFQGETATRSLIRHGIESAARYGIISNAGIIVLVTLMFMLGSGCDRDLLYPWAQGILEDATITGEGARVDRLHAEAMNYLNASFVRGKGEGPQP